MEGAVLSGYGECEVTEKYWTYIYIHEGAAAEVKLSWSSGYTSCTSLADTPEIAQLIASMEKLAGDLAHCVVMDSALLFHSTTIFGVLMNYGSKRSILVKLHIDYIFYLPTTFSNLLELHHCIDSRMWRVLSLCSTYARGSGM